jgi:hypothetical protein
LGRIRQRALPYCISLYMFNYTEFLVNYVPVSPNVT